MLFNKFFQYYICQYAEYSRYLITWKGLVFTELNIRTINSFKNEKFAKVNIHLLKIFQKWHKKHLNHKSFHCNFSKISKFAKIHSAKINQFITLHGDVKNWAKSRKIPISYRNHFKYYVEKNLYETYILQE